MTMECCKQMVGRKCLEKWVKGRAVNKNKCPTCRKELFSKTSTRSTGSRASNVIATPGPSRDNRSLRNLLQSVPRSTSSSTPRAEPPTPPSRVRPPPTNFPQSIPRSAPSSAPRADLPTPPLRNHPPATNFPQSVPGSVTSPFARAIPPPVPSVVSEWRFSQDFRVNHASLIQEAQALWDSLISHPRLFDLLWTEIQDRYLSMGYSVPDPRNPRGQVSPTRLSEFVLNTVTDEFTFGDTNSYDQPMLRYMHHLQRYPNFIHTEAQEDAILSGREHESVSAEQFHALLLTKPLLHCVELMSRCIQLVREPKHVSANVFVQVTNYLQNNKPAWQLKAICWEYLFRPTLIGQTVRRGDSCFPTLRLLSVLLMSSSVNNILRELSLEGNVQASLSDTSVRQSYDRLLAELQDRTRSGRGGQLEQLAQLSGAALAESWQRVMMNSSP